MKAITIAQPWAALVAHGEKKYHSVNWTTDYRGPLAIFAAPFKSDYAQKEASDQPIADLLAKHNLTFASLPTGVVVATVNLVAVHHSPYIARQFNRQERKLNEKHWLAKYTLEFQDVVLLEEPVPATAGDGNLWDFGGDPPQTQEETKDKPARPKAK